MKKGLIIGAAVLLLLGAGGTSKKDSSLPRRSRRDPCRQPSS